MSLLECTFPTGQPQAGPQQPPRGAQFDGHWEISPLHHLASASCTALREEMLMKNTWRMFNPKIERDGAFAYSVIKDGSPAMPGARGTRGAVPLGALFRRGLPVRIQGLESLPF